MHAPLGLDFSYGRSSSELGSERRGIDQRVFGSAGLQPIPTPGAPPQKQSYMARVANGFGFMSKGSAGESQKEKESPNPSNRSRSKSNSRPGTAGGLITTTTTIAATSMTGTTNKTKALDVDKPLPSRPVSSSNTHHHRYSLRADGGTLASTPFGTLGSYSLLFVDHELEALSHPPRPNSAANLINGRPRSISTSAGGTPATTRPPSVVNSAGARIKLEPIIPVHVLDKMVSASPQEMTPVVAAAQKYFPLSQGASILQRRESNRSRRVGEAREELMQSSTPVQDAEMVVRARSLSRSNSAARMGAYSRRPSKSSSLRRELRAESPLNDAGEGSYSRSASRSASVYNGIVSRSNSMVSRRRLAVESGPESEGEEGEEAEEGEGEEERRGRGRSPGGRKAVRRFNSVDREDNLSRITEYGPGDQQQLQEHARGREEDPQENDLDSRDVWNTKRATALARKPVPVPVPARKSSRSASRSRSRSTSSRLPQPTSLEGNTASTAMRTISEVQVASVPAVAAAAPRPRLIDLDSYKGSGSRTPSPSPLRPSLALAGARARSGNGSSSSLRAKYHADEGRPPASAPAAPAALSGLPKRKPVPQSPSPTSSTLPTLPSQLLLLRPKNPMVVAIPPPPGSLQTDSPVSGGDGKSTAGLVSSEDELEEDVVKTPATATFSFVTPLLPSPPKRVSPHGQQQQQQQAGHDAPSRIPQTGPPPPPPQAPTSSGPSASPPPSPLPISSAPPDPHWPPPPQSSAPPVIQVRVHEPPVDGNYDIDFPAHARPTPPSTAHHSPASTPSPVSPVSPLYPPPSLPDSGTLSHSSPAHLLERARWESERISLQTQLAALTHENQTLKDLVFKLTEMVERQDMELRKHQQQQQHARAHAYATPKTLPLRAAGSPAPARGTLPQGWSVFTNPRTPPPPKPKARMELPEPAVYQVLALGNKEISVNTGPEDQKPIGHRRGSVSMSTGSSPPPLARPGLKKGFSHSLPLLNAGASAQKGAPVVLGLSVSAAVELGKKGSLGQGKGGKGMVGSDAIVATGKSPKARALWKRTTAAVAGGRKAQARGGEEYRRG